MDWIAILKSAFAPYIDDKKPPLHIGEAFNLWYYLIGVEQSKRSTEVGFNSAQDAALRDRLQDLMQGVHNPIIQELQEFLKSENVPLPDVTPEKPINGSYKDIPPGAKLTDEEIANLVIFNELVGIQIAGKALTESVRADVGGMFTKYFMMKVAWSLTLKQLMQERGWLRIPPPFKA